MKTVQTVVYVVAAIVAFIVVNEMLTYWPLMPLAAPATVIVLFGGLGFLAYLFGKDVH